MEKIVKFIQTFDLELCVEVFFFNFHLYTYQYFAHAPAGDPRGHKKVSDHQGLQVQVVVRSGSLSESRCIIYFYRLSLFSLSSNWSIFWHYKLFSFEDFDINYSYSRNS